MGSRHAPTSRCDTRRFETKDEFVEACVEAMGRLDFVAMFKSPPTATNFMEAYALARCLPIIMNRGKHVPANWESDEFGDELAKLASIGERFLNQWAPTSAMEAALMLDLFNATDDYPDYLWRVPTRVETWLFQNGFAGDELALATSMMTRLAQVGQQATR